MSPTVRKLIVPREDKLIVTSEHDVSESRYHSNNPIIQHIYRSRLRTALSMIKGGRILEIGCGSGVLTPSLQAISSDVVSMDIHGKLDDVHDKIPGNYVKGSIFALPFKEKFDTVICLSVLEHLEDFEKALVEVKKHLSDKGAVIWGFPSNHFLIRSWLWVNKSPAFKNHINGRGVLLKGIRKHYKILERKTLRLGIPDYYTVVKCRVIN